MSSIPLGDDESLLRQWEAAQARYRSPLVLRPNILSERSGGQYANEVGYNVSVSQGNVSVEIWGEGGGTTSASMRHGGAGGSSEFGVSIGMAHNYLSYHTDESTGAQMALAAGDVARSSCWHDLAVPVDLMLTDERVAWLCELCLAQLPANWQPPACPPDEHNKSILNQYGERVAYWTTESGEWIIVRV